MKSETTQIEFNELCDETMYVIDVRSPMEYEEFHLPYSINLPLLSNEERKVIGTIYKQENPCKAKIKGIEILSTHLPRLYAEWLALEEMYPNKQPIVMCARGGMRSKVVVSTMRGVGIDALQLVGGMRSIRRNVQSKLEEFAQLKWTGIVLSGNTGTGKTRFLLKLAEKGYPVLNLEDLAGHRGSAFGHIGLQHKTQKQFEFELVRKLDENKGSRTLILEAESKRIGRIIVPDFIMKIKEDSKVIELIDTLEKRVERLIEDYAPSEHHDQLIEAYQIIRKRISPAYQEIIDEAFLHENYSRAFAMLMTEYYDPRYDHSNKNDSENLIKPIHLNDLSEEESIRKIEEAIQKNLQPFNYIE